jgi:hypothetical protein
VYSREYETAKKFLHHSLKIFDSLRQPLNRSYKRSFPAAKQRTFKDDKMYSIVSQYSVAALAWDRTLHCRRHTALVSRNQQPTGGANLECWTKWQHDEQHASR